MEKLKDPAMLLAVANSIGIVGTTAYFYKQLEAMRLDMVKMSQTLTGVIKKLSEIDKGSQSRDEALHLLGDQMKRINQHLEDVPSFENLENIEMDLNEIVTVLEENEIPVERPSQLPTYGRRRSGDRRSSNRPRNDETDDRRVLDTSGRRVATRSTGFGSSDRSRDERSRSDRDLENMREQTRPPPRRVADRQPRQDSVREQPRGETRAEPANGYDDDADLIETVRRQQTR